MVERVLFSPGGATEARQDDLVAALADILTELAGKLEAGQQVALAAATIAALTPQTDALTDNELRADPVPIEGGTDRERTHVVATVTDAGDTTIHTPAAGMAIRLHWIYAINDPSSASPPLIKVRLGGSELYRAWALSKTQVKTGAADAPLVVNLSAEANVAVTALIEEVSP